MHRFEDRLVEADIRGGGESQSSDQAGDEIGKDVAEHVFHHEDIELIRVDHQLHGRRIDNPIFEIDLAFVFAGDFTADIEEEPLGAFQDVRFVGESHFPAAIGFSEFKGVPDDSL